MQVSENEIFSKINLQIWTFLWRVWRTFHLKLIYWKGNTILALDTPNIRLGNICYKMGLFIWETSFSLQNAEISEKKNRTLLNGLNTAEKLCLSTLITFAYQLYYTM